MTEPTNNEIRLESELAEARAEIARLRGTLECKHRDSKAEQKRLSTGARPRGK